MHRMIKKTEVSIMRFVWNLIEAAIGIYLLVAIIAVFIQHPPW